ncbi:MAG: 3-methyl-2-oxobutanoate hydroxymethyltransferase [Candidatus Binatia bacterium]
MKITVPVLQQMKRDGRKITAVLAADFRSLEIIDRAAVDIVLIADSAGVNIFGHRSPKETTMEELLLLCHGARRALTRPFLLVDLPFGACHSSIEDTVRSSVRLVKEGGADGVKLESDRETIGSVRAIAGAGIPVMAHIGASPHVQARLGSFEEARSAISDDELVELAAQMEDAGAFALDLTMGGTATRRVVDTVKIPVLGGRGTTTESDGQFLQLHRLAGWSVGALDNDIPRYASMAQVLLDAVNAYVADVQNGKLGKGRE